MQHNSLAMKIALAEDKTARGSIIVAPRLGESDVFLHGQELTLAQQRLWKHEAMLRVQWPATHGLSATVT